MTRSFGTTKQSPSPQHHSPAALRWPTREIQLSWANVSGMTRARPAKTSANRARLPIMGTSLSLSRHGSRSNHAPVADMHSARVFVDKLNRGGGCATPSANQPLDLEV